ncbi:MAG: CsgG/HfaB family protein [Candidatus Brocadiia bacterium]
MKKHVLSGLVAGLALSFIAGCGSSSVSSSYTKDTTPVTQYTPPPVNIQVKRIAILPFKDKTTNSPIKGDVGSMAVDQLTTLLVNTGRFSVIERERLDAVLQEQGLAGKGMLDPATAAQVGKILGAELVFTGSITNWEVREAKEGTFVLLGGSSARTIDIDLALDGRIINTTTSEIMFADSGEIKRQEKVTATAVLSGSPGAYVKLDQSVAGKQLRLGLDDMLSKIIPKVDAKFSR